MKDELIDAIVESKPMFLGPAIKKPPLKRIMMRGGPGADYSQTRSLRIRQAQQATDAMQLWLHPQRKSSFASIARFWQQLYRRSSVCESRHTVRALQCGL